MDLIELRQPRAIPAFLVVAGAAVGALLGALGPAWARGLATLIDRTPFPVHGLVRRLGELDLAWSLPLLGGAGFLGGIFLAITAVREAPALDVADTHVEHRHAGRESWVERTEVSVAFLDGKELVLLRPEGTLRARLDVEDLPRDRLLESLRTRGWPVYDDDPFETEFVPWADGRPGFTAEENALLRRRHDERKDPTARRTTDDELARSGIVTRDRGNRLQVRRVRSA